MVKCCWECLRMAFFSPTSFCCWNFSTHGNSNGGVVAFLLLFRWKKTNTGKETLQEFLVLPLGRFQLRMYFFFLSSVSLDTHIERIQLQWAYGRTYQWDSDFQHNLMESRTHRAFARSFSIDVCVVVSFSCIVVRPKKEVRRSIQSNQTFTQ